MPTSVVYPVHVTEHLGFILNSVEMKVTMTAGKVNKILELIRKLLGQDICPIRLETGVIGKINATRPAKPFAALFTTWK